MIYLITGQPGTGKTSYADKLCELLRKSSTPVIRFDGDHMRKCWPHLGYDKEGRTQNMLYLFELTKTLWERPESPHIVISAVFPIAQERERFHFQFREDVMEVYLDKRHAERPPEYYCPFERSTVCKPHFNGSEKAQELLGGLA